jgi:autotransporter adhesin
MLRTAPECVHSVNDIISRKPILLKLFNARRAVGRPCLRKAAAGPLVTLIAAYFGAVPAGASECITSVSTSKVNVVDSVTPKKVIGIVVDVKTTETSVVSDVTASNGGASSVLGGLACGDNAIAGSSTATAAGTDSYAASKRSSAFGHSAKALALNSSAFGTEARATAAYSSAFGAQTDATGENSSAFGAGAKTSGFNSSAFGQGSQASGTNSSAFGQGAQATATGATAVGQGANAGHANATAVGTGAATTRADQMMFGTAGNTYTAPGITSAASKAAQSGPVSFVTTDAQGNLATDGGAITSQINQAFKRLDENAQGIAIALAMGGIYVPESKLFSFAAGYGTFDGANAFATQLAFRLDANTILTGGVGVGLENNDAPTKMGGRVGFQVSW